MAPVIVTGSWTEKMRFEAFLVFTTLWPILVYYPIAHWVWGNGWLHQQFGVYDFAGGIVIHTTSGVAGFVVACMLTRRRPTDHLAFHNLPLSYIGNVLVFVAWYFFNASSAVAANSVATTALINTHLAACTSGLLWTLLCYYAEQPRRWHLTEFMGGMLAGLAAITPNSGYVSPYMSIVIATIGGFFSWLSNRIIKRSGIDDVLSVASLQGVPGAVGTILLGLFADPSVFIVNYKAGDISKKPIGVFFASSDAQLKEAWKFFGGQIFGVLFAAVWTTIFTYMIMKFIESLVNYDIDHFTEEIGLDMKQIGEQAYDDSLDVVLDLGETTSAALLIEAAANGYLTEVDRLIRGGVSPNAMDYDSRTALMLAAAEGRLTIVRYLVERHLVNVNIRDKFGNTALVEALRNNKRKISEYLVAHNAKVPLSLGPEMLLEAASNINEDTTLVSLLLRANVDPNSVDYDKRTPLMFATCSNHYDTVKLLIDSNAAIDQTDRWGRTALDDAKDFKRVEIISLLDKGTFSTDLKTITPISSPQNKLLKKQISLRVILSREDDDDDDEDQKEVVDDEAYNTINRGPDVRDSCAAAADGDIVELKRLYKRGVNLIAAEYDGRTPVHLAAARGHLKVLKYLISLDGMNINVVDRFRMTPLAEAITNGHHNCAELLRKAGGLTANMKAGPKLCNAAANGNLKELKKFHDLGYDMMVGDADLRTALMLASCEGHLDCVKFLIECGVDINSKDRFGNTAIDEAISNGHDDIVEFLQQKTSEI